MRLLMRPSILHTEAMGELGSGHIKVMLSRQLLMKEMDGVPIIFHNLSGTALRASSDLLEFLCQFKKPIRLHLLNDRYYLPDLQSAFRRLVDLGFLIPEPEDEERNWLRQEMPRPGMRVYETENFRTYYPIDGGFAARELADLMEGRYSYLLSRGFPLLKQSVLIYLCNNSREYRTLSGDFRLPEWTNAFVIKGRILVVDPTVKAIDANHAMGFTRGMTHELVHAFLHQLAWQLPVWLEEGLCEYFSQPYSPSHFRHLAKQKGLFDFRELEMAVNHSLLDLDDSPIEMNTCYKQSESFVAYLAHFLGEKKLIQFVESLEFGKDFGRQLEQFFKRSMDCLVKEWVLDDGLSP